MLLTAPNGFRLRPGTNAYDAAWFEHYASMVPGQWRKRLERTYARLRAKSEGSAAHREFVANSWLRGVGESLGNLLLPLSAGDADIRAAADAMALDCMRTAGEVSRDLDTYHEAAVRYVRGRGCRPPDVGDKRGALARMTCPLWWRRQLRRLHGRKIERHAIGFGYVHAKAEKYVSDVNVQRRQEQKRRNAATLAGVVAENQHGDEMTLAELAERSNACPRIRRAELMTRIAGFESVARGLGHVAEFWTLTAPSRFHARLAADGSENTRYKGATPREAQAHLSAAWARLRAFMHRRGVRWYGFRVAEPHHDGCPHWHVLLFMPAEAVSTARRAARLYFLFRHDRREPGAYRNRVKFVSVEMTDARSAAGYIAKYISKNIDGYQVQRDLYGHDAVAGAARIDAWAATWGIRQFQQVGGAPVGVWRELRRMKADEAHTDTVADAVAAADAGAWSAYVTLQGGPVVERKALRLMLARTRPGEKWNPVGMAPEPADASRYGEERPGVVWGVEDVRKGRAFLSRFYRWSIKRAAVAVGAFGFPWTRVNNCTGGGGYVGIVVDVPMRDESACLVPDMPVLQESAADRVKWLDGDEFEEWTRRKDVKPEFAEWWRHALSGAGSRCEVVGGSRSEPAGVEFRGRAAPLPPERPPGTGGAESERVGDV